MLRRCGLAVLLVWGWVGLAGLPRAAFAQRPATSTDGTKLSLQETLEKGLKARRPEEFAFLARVAEQVELGNLPRSLVDTTFSWARRKPHPRVVYFEQALRVRARRLGLSI
jgi:hypothetical protein